MVKVIFVFEKQISVPLLELPGSMLAL